MKIEKVNSNQIKCFLNKGDLLSRQIKVSELAYGTEKAQELFRDMMEQASTEFGFEVENVPLMIEAVPLSTDSIMLIITKVENPEELEDKFSSLPVSDSRKFKRKELSTKEESHTNIQEADELHTSVNAFLVYRFSKFEDMCTVSERLIEYPIDKSSIYKNPSDGKFYLALSITSIERKHLKIMKGVLAEYSDQVTNKKTILGYYDEHFEPIIKDKAIEVLVSI